MSNQPTVNGIPCNPGRVLGPGGHYIVEINKGDATLEQIEAIDWSNPTLENTGDSLPDSYGYEVTDVRYSYQYKKFQVHLKVKEEYLGDVVGYQAQIQELETSLATTEEEKAAAQAQAQAAEAEAATAQAQAQQATEDCLAAQQEAKTAQQMAASSQEQVGILAGKPLDDAAEARALRIAIESAVVSLDDDQASDVPSLFAPWAVGEAVEPGDRRYYAPTGRLYKVREGQGHTTQADWTPDKTPAMWTVVGDPDTAGTLEDPIPAARGMEYTYGLYYKDPEDSQTYLCQREGEEAGGKIVLQFLPHELVGQYFSAVSA